MRSRKIETTPPSRLASCRGPKTFPKRSTTCPVPWMRFQPARYCSAQSFAIPYGESGLERAVLARRAVALAVDRAAGGGEDDLRARAARRLEHLHGADDVDRGVVLGARDRGHHVGLRGEVEDDVGLAELEAVADVALRRSVGRGVQVLALAGREVVDDDHLVAALDETVDEVRPDEPGATGYDRPHASVS